MIRALALILGLLLGLSAAVVAGGRMAHLRALAGDALPGWTQGLAADAGTLRGQGTLNGAALRWRLDGLDAGGPRWAVSLAGSDWQARATMRLGLAGLRFEAVQGLVPGGLLAEGGQGALAVTDGALWLAPSGGGALDGWLEGRANALVLAPDTAPIQGEVRLSGADGDWGVTPP